MYRYTSLFMLLLTLGFSSTWVGLDSKTPKLIKPSVISSDIQETYLSFEFEGYHSIDIQTPNGLESIINLERGSSILESGAPDLDKWTSSIIIPDEGSTSVEVISSSYHDFYDIAVAPSKGNFSRMIYPGTLAELRDPYILRDLRGQTVVVYPLHYNPQTKTLRLYTHIELKVTTVGGGGANLLHRSSSQQSVSKEFNTIYQDMFLNYNNYSLSTFKNK